ncbi:hypothetical protein GCM10027180_00380 [Microbulbifer echini]
MLVMPTVRTRKFVWSTPLAESIETLLFGAIFVEELSQANAFLELHLITGHDLFPFESTRQLYLYTSDFDLVRVLIR